MKILSAAQTRALDHATIEEQNITSADLMERAAAVFVEWLIRGTLANHTGKMLVLCGPGNNGGDGLAVARLLHLSGYGVRVLLLPATRHSADWQHHHELLPKNIPVNELVPEHLPALRAGTVVIDALFGTGLSRPLQGPAAAVVTHLNQSKANVYAIDLPSGLFADQPQPTDGPVVHAKATLSFGLPKLAMLLPQSAVFLGDWNVEDIQLSKAFVEHAATPWHLTQTSQPKQTWLTHYAKPDVQLPKRDKFAYKNTFGHALLLAGSRGKVGAAVLAAGACLRGGVGLLTVAIPHIGSGSMQTSHPEAMCLPDAEANFISELPDLAPYQAIGIGPGLGQEAASRAVLQQLLRTAKVPLVIDADALNLLGTHRELLELLPEDTVLTPHPGEFARLTEKARDDYHRLELLRAFAQAHRCIVVLKGAYTAVANRDGQVYFNTTGNPGMATGGSGDVLTGLVLALRADKRLAPLPAVRLAVLAHGHAADLAVQETGEAGLLAGDIVRFIGPALQSLTA
jgi:NAD(P)H-hydrate epimerase